MKRFLDMVFDADMKTATRGEEAIRFSKTERLLLATLSRHRGRLLTRDQLLDAVAQDGPASSDRNIDYLINRLRRKLNDDAKTPRFIATRYGEGYVWLPGAENADLAGAFLVIGPVHGLSGEGFDPQVRAMIQRLRQELVRKFTPDRKVVIAAGLDLRSEAAGGEYGLELGFLAEGGRVHGRAILRHVQSWQIIAIRKFSLDGDTVAALETAATALATEVVEQVVLHKSETGTQKMPIPLELSVFEASRLLALPDADWVESGQILARRRQEAPEDPKLAIMWASHLYATLVLAPLIGSFDANRRAETEREIESLCLEFLPKAQNHPVLRLCIAKLLFYIDRGHLELVESLMAEVYDQEIGFSSVYPLLGELRAARGEFDEAIRYYDHALRLAEKDSRYRVYVTVLKLTSLLAAGRREELEREAAALHALEPQTIHTVGLFLGRPEDPLRPEHAVYLDRLGAERALALVGYFYHTAARHFHAPLHRERIYIGFATQVERRFGVRFVPPSR